jgi:hypothetical protein
MKRLFASVAILIGVGLVALGLLFLLASGRSPYRLPIAIGLMLTGAAAIGLALRSLQRARAEDPEQLRAEILALAQRQDGETSFAELQAALGPRFIRAQSVLAELTSAGTCIAERKLGTTYYRFPELLPRLHVRRCEYCQAELSLGEALSKCPQCGGTVKTQVEQRTLESKMYGMDE